MLDADILKKIESLWHRKITRGDFIKGCVALGVGVGLSGFLFKALSRYEAFAAIGERRGMKEARFYRKHGDSVQCVLCANHCVLSDGQRGFCRVREPVGSKLYTLVYELICSAHIDPIEKKPLYHMLPASRTLSIATAGCNSRCKFCQNWTISQRPPEQTTNRVLRISDLVAGAVRQNCASISYTYTEPIVYYEYAVDAGEAAHKAGLYNLWVTGGKINPKPLRLACKTIDAANIDFKGFDEKYLREICAQDLDNILETIVIMKEEGVWIELTNLIVPTLNDDMGTIRKMVRWVRDNVGKDVPMHFSRFWPQYQLRALHPTPVETLLRAREIAFEEGLRYVYLGNVRGRGFENTVCPDCGNIVISRMGYTVTGNRVSAEGKCGFCGHNIPGIWKKAKG